MVSNMVEWQLVRWEAWRAISSEIARASGREAKWLVHSGLSSPLRETMHGANFALTQRAVNQVAIGL